MIAGVKIENFTAFGNLEITLSPRVNVIIGSNGTGKTHLLKAIYGLALAGLPASADSSAKEVAADISRKLLRLFEAAEDTIGEIVRLVKKLNGANAANMIVTADHGFIYQHRPIEESDFSSAQVEGDTILYRDRRFILGHGLKANHGLRRFTPEQANLQGSVEVLIPKSINRLRRQGSGSRFVHGGATLQEVVVPVVKINKKRQSDTSTVEVEIIGSSNQMITSSQISVRFYQATAVTEKTQSLQLRAGIYAQSGELISDRHDLVFDFRSDNPREREIPVRFLLSRQADAFNDQEVILKLEQRHGETSHFREYRAARYRLKRSFSNDFDF